ncbi:MAG: alpha/beta hydrolase [bacterium]
MTLAACDTRAPEQRHDVAAEAKGHARSAPTRTGYADVGGARFYYQIHGDIGSGKTPLLVLHGSYMSGDAMAPLVEQFAATRPVIAVDARGHGRTGDLPGPITYDQLADDAAGVLNALKVPTADVLGYSMGGITALALAVRHPDKVGKQIILSGTSRRNGWYPELNESFKKVTPAAFAGTPLESEYMRLSPTPNAFATLVGKLRTLDGSNYDMPDDAIRGIHDKTMIVVGDADGVTLEYAVELFKLRGGGDKKAILQGFMAESPRARLLILPGTTHIGIMANAERIAQLGVPFLDDAKPPIPPGFLKDSSGSR